MFVLSHYLHLVPCSRRTPSSSTEEKMWHLGCGCKARFRSAHVHPTSPPKTRSLQNLRRYLKSISNNVEICLNLWVCSCLLVHGDVSKENVLDMEAIELAQRVAWLHHVATRVAPVAVMSQGHGGKCGFVHGTHRFLEFEPLRATWWQFGRNQLGLLLAAILHHVSIVSDVFSMLSFHPAFNLAVTPRLDKARCLVCT